MVAATEYPQGADAQPQPHDYAAHLVALLRTGHVGIAEAMRHLERRFASAYAALEAGATDGLDVEGAIDVVKVGQVRRGGTGAKAAHTCAQLLSRAHMYTCTCSKSRVRKPMCLAHHLMALSFANYLLGRSQRSGMHCACAKPHRGCAWCMLAC